jgi:hypothetical protein
VFESTVLSAARLTALLLLPRVAEFLRDTLAGGPLCVPKIEDALERDYFLTGEMAMEWGIVDKVINKRPEDPAALKVA